MKEIETSYASQVLAWLIIDPFFLDRTDKYKISSKDFKNTEQRILFKAIYNIHNKTKNNKIDKKTLIDYLQATKIGKATIIDTDKGMLFIDNIFTTVALFENNPKEDFNIYYNRFKTNLLLCELEEKGYNTSQFDNITDENTPIDICNYLKGEILGLQSEYATNETVQEFSIADCIDDLIMNFGTADEVGLPLQGRLFTSIINGALGGTLTVRSAASGSFKTRTAIADACYLAYPIRYSSDGWELTGQSNKVLFVMTEQKETEIFSMVLAYLSGINESRFKFGQFTEMEQHRISIAINIIKRYKDNLHLIRMPDPDVSTIKSILTEQIINYDIKYIFFDYIFISNGVLREYRGSNLRNDEVLLLMSTALKDIAVQYNVSIFTSTQLNAKGDDNKELRNESSLAGSRAIINKADNGIIMHRPKKEDLELISNIQFNGKIPNIISDVYKVRNGMWSQVKIWSHFDAGTLRMEDLFITNQYDEVVNITEDFANRIIDPDQEDEKFLKEICNG